MYESGDSNRKQTDGHQLIPGSCFVKHWGLPYYPDSGRSYFPEKLVCLGLYLLPMLNMTMGLLAGVIHFGVA